MEVIRFFFLKKKNNFNLIKTIAGSSLLLILTLDIILGTLYACEVEFMSGIS